MATLFVVLIQSAYRVPLQNKATGFALKAMGSACLSLCLSTTGQYSFQGFFYQPFQSGGPRATEGGAMPQHPCLGKKGSDDSRLYSTSQFFPLLLKGSFTVYSIVG